MAVGSHPFPFRTRKLSPPAPMVLGRRLPGRVGRRRISQYEKGPFGGPFHVFPRPLRRSCRSPPLGTVDSSHASIFVARFSALSEGFLRWFPWGPPERSLLWRSLSIGFLGRLVRWFSFLLSSRRRVDLGRITCWRRLIRFRSSTIVRGRFGPFWFGEAGLGSLRSSEARRFTGRSAEEHRARSSLGGRHLPFVGAVLGRRAQFVRSLGFHLGSPGIVVRRVPIGFLRRRFAFRSRPFWGSEQCSSRGRTPGIGRTCRSGVVSEHRPVRSAP